MKLFYVYASKFSQGELIRVKIFARRINTLRCFYDTPKIFSRVGLLHGTYTVTVNMTEF